MSFLVEDLIESVKRGYVPFSQNTETDDTVIERLSDDLNLNIVPALESVKENFFLTYTRIPIIANQTLYTIPRRASGVALKDVWLLDGSYNRIRTLPRCDIHDITRFQAAGNSLIQFVLQGNQIKLFPTPSTTQGYLELWYYMRPNRLTATVNCAKITAISSDSTSVTCTVDTDQTSSWSAGTTIDAINSISPFPMWGYDIPITSITSTQIVFPKSYVVDELGNVTLGVGDYLCPAKYANIAMVPEEFHPVLAQATASAITVSMGDLSKGQAAQAVFVQMMQAALKLISNRIEDEPELIQSNDSVLSSVGNNLYGYQTLWR